MEYEAILSVDYSEKDQAKVLGARWNPKIKKWYVPKGMSLAPFERWLEGESEVTYAVGNIYVIESVTSCWKCRGNATVYCLASDGYDDGYGKESCFVTYSNLSMPPESIRNLLLANFSNYYEDFSRTVGGRYYMNHCDCGAKLGDFYLHEEPGGAFFPAVPSQLANVVIHSISDSPVKLALQASVCIQSPNYIEELVSTL